MEEEGNDETGIDCKKILFHIHYPPSLCTSATILSLKSLENKYLYFLYSEAFHTGYGGVRK